MEDLFETPLRDCGMDEIERRIWHGDLELYEKLDHFVRNTDQDERSDVLSYLESYESTGTYVKYDPTNPCQDDTNSGHPQQLLSKVAYETHNYNESIVPAYGWLKDWLCKNASDFQYQEFVVGTRINFEYRHVVPEPKEAIEISEFAKMIATKYHDEKPYFVKLRMESMYLKTYDKDFTWMITACLVYLPYLKITSPFQALPPLGS
jgi:hypothetical protein